VAQRNSTDVLKILRSLSVVIRLLFVTTSTYDKLVVTQTPKGSRIDGFVSGETQARLVFTRGGEEIELLCMTEELACAELAMIEALSGWQLVEAQLVRFPQPHRARHAARGRDGSANAAEAKRTAAA
jgi:hypothetical protein